MSPERTAVSSRSVETPIGRLVLTATSRGLSRIDLVTDNAPEEPLDGSGPGAEHLQHAERALRAYFSGAPSTVFGDVPLDPEGTPFQRSVWEALRSIPHGTTISYRMLAERIGKPAAMRAVGLANGRNPLPIVVPCHRVIGADGSLTGFGLGVDVKAWLLVHEGAAEPFAEPVTPRTHLLRRASAAR
ncbi:MAG: methylated-DNA--[protein]-cysteine S-methyltransferase [Vicinamibacterales bacterium]